MKKKNMPQGENVQGKQKPKRSGKEILNTVVNVILVVALVVAALCTYTSFVSTSGNGVPSILGVRMFSIQTESMYPTMNPGDLIFGTGIDDMSELRPGDVITYWTVINGERVLNTHRIEEIYDGNGFLIFATKGDKNPGVDALTVHESEVVAKWTGMKVGGLGKVFDYLQTSTGFLIVVVIPVFLFFLFHLVQFFRVLFEYQNVKNRIKFEQERGRTEDLIVQQQTAQAQAREKMEAELRERLRAEIMASMKEQQNAAPPAAEPVKEEPAEEAPVAEEPVVEETPAEEPAAEEVPAEEPVAEEAAAEEPAKEETPAEEPKAEEKPALDEAAIEAMIAKQREAIEAQLREKIMAEMRAAQTAAEPAKTENAEDAVEA